MFLLKNTIFKKFGSIEKLNDTYKNVNGKGIFERYNETLGDDFDENVLSFINNLVNNTSDPRTVYEKYISYIEYKLGYNIGLFSETEKRRKVIQLINRYYEIKGTLRGYEIMFKWLGFTSVGIIEHDEASGFDSPVTFDDSLRSFDGSCEGLGCSYYSIQLVGDMEPNNGLIQQVLNVIKFNEPIDAKIRSLSLNGNVLIREVINVYISDGTDGYGEGDLIYENLYDADLILKLVDGDLTVEGPNAQYYSINDNGDLIYTFGLFYFNNALKLNGIDQKVYLNHIPEYNFTGDNFETSIWFKPQISTGNHPIISKVLGTKGYSLKYINGKFVVKGQDGTNENEIETVNTFTDLSKWYFIVCDFIGTDASNWKIYVNAVSENTNVITNDLTSLDFDNNNQLTLGSEDTSFGQIIIDEFFLKTGNMTQSQITDLYNYGDGKDAVSIGVSDIVLRLNFDELTGLTIFDVSDNENNAILDGIGDSTNRILH